MKAAKTSSKNETMQLHKYETQPQKVGAQRKLRPAITTHMKARTNILSKNKPSHHSHANAKNTMHEGENQQVLRRQIIAICSKAIARYGVREAGIMK
jgi:hypothetical protein